MSEEYSPVCNLLSEDIEQDERYNRVAQQIIDQTNEYTEDSGVIACPDAATALIAKDILSDVYYVEIKPLQQDSEYDLAYHVVYNRELDEEVKGWVKKNKKGIDVGLGGIKFLSDRGSDRAIANFNRAATPVGDMPSSGGAGGDAGAGGMGESWEDPEAETICPLCGGKISFIGGQGDYWEYNCDDCGEWLYLDHSDKFHKADNVWNEDQLNEANEDDSFLDYQRKMSNTQTENQANKLREMEQALNDLGYKASIEQLLPEEFNVYFTIKGSSELEPEEERVKIIELFDSFGAQKIKFNQCEIIPESHWGDPAYFYAIGAVYIPGMSLGEDIEEDIENHDELNQDIFEGDELKEEVRTKLLEIVDKFAQNMADNEIKFDIKDAQIVGSSAGYNYTKDSDIDLHIFADLGAYDDEELAQKLYDARKTIWNDKYDPTIFGREVEIYVEPAKDAEPELEEAVSKGAYSLFTGWVSKPEPEEHEDIDIEDELQDYIYQAEHCKTVEDIDEFLDRVHDMRQKGLLRGGEWDKDNLIFKELRNRGIIQDLKDIKVKLLNQEMSL